MIAVPGLTPSWVPQFILIVIIAATAKGLAERTLWSFPATELAWLGSSGTLLIVMPIYILQLGIGRSVPLTANIDRALEPIVVFSTQLADPRIMFSSCSLCALSLYAIYFIGAILARARAAPKPV